MNSTTISETRKETFFDRINFFAKKGNLSRANFFELDAVLAEIGSQLRNGKLTANNIDTLRAYFDHKFLKSTMQGRGFLKPNGYAGDYLLLDRIYTRHIANETEYGIWDEYFQQHAAPTAVRNRKAYFKNLVTKKIRQRDDLEVLNVVSGSARELCEIYETLSTKKKLRTTCVELDAKAIAYAKKLNSQFLDCISFVHSTIFKYRTDSKFDFIWSAGLFDYLDDRSFVLLLKKLSINLKKGGELVVGNFNQDHNPSRDYMQILGDWHLIHRTAEELADLAAQAGFAAKDVHIGSEEQNVNLFLHVRR